MPVKTTTKLGCAHVLGIASALVLATSTTAVYLYLKPKLGDLPSSQFVDEAEFVSDPSKLVAIIRDLYGLTATVIEMCFRWLEIVVVCGALSLLSSLLSIRYARRLRSSGLR